MGTATSTSRRQGARLLITLVATLSLIATQLTVFAVAPADAATPYVPSPSVAPAYTGPAERFVIDGNPNCAALGDEFDLEFAGEIKFDPGPSAGSSITRDGVTVTITDRYTTRNGVPGLFFDYTVSGGTVEGVLMKQGPGGLFYRYDPAVAADQGLHSQERNGVIWAGVSHISFCYSPTPPPATGTIELDKVDEEDRALAGATLQLFDGAPGAGGPQVGDDCVTDGVEPCTFADLPFGTYTAVEAAAPDGYRLAGSSPRELTLSAQSPQLTETFAFVNERIPYRISVEPDAVNPVGDPHDFTVLLETQDADGTWRALPGADLELAYAAADGFAEAGQLIAVDAGSVTSDTTATCTTAGGEGALAAGTCVVTVNSATPAKGVLTATFTTPYQHATSTTASGSTTVGAAGVPGAIADEAAKEWRGLHVDLVDDGVNLVGSPHPFTVTVTDSDGAPLGGASVTIAWDGPAGTAIDGVVVGDDGEPVEITVATAADGTATVTVTSDEVARGTATVTRVVGSVDGLTLTVPSAGDPATGQLPLEFAEDDDRTATKDWIDHRVEVSGDAVNYIEWPHPFTIRVYELTPGGPAGGTLLPGATVLADWTSLEGANGVVEADRVDPADDTRGTCVTDADGACTITVAPTSDAVPSSGTLTVAAIADVGVDADGVVDPSRSGGVTLDLAPVEATKEWVDYGVDVTPDGVNPIGTANPDDSRHTFTVSVTRSASSLDADGDLAGIVVDLVWVGDVGAIVEVDGTALDPATDATACVTDAAGTCTVVVDADEVGSGSLIVTGLTDGNVSDDANDAAEVTFLAAEDVADHVCPAEAEGLARICATKTWVAFQLQVTPPFETNHVDVEHTFDVELLGLPEGATVDGFASGFTGDLADEITIVADTCTDGDNPCAITVATDAPGSLRLTVTAADITIPGEGSFTVPFGTGTTIGVPAAANQADKDYVDYLVAFEPPATNLLGDEHPFEVTISRITGIDGDGQPVTEPAADVTTTLCWEGAFGSALQEGGADGCIEATTDAYGVARVTVDAPAAPADGELTVASLTADGDVVLPEGGVTSFHYVDGRESAEKAWIAFRVSVTPDEATNLAGDDLNPGRSVHDFTVRVQVAREVPAAPVGDPADPATWTFEDYEGATIDVTDQVTWTPDDSTYVSDTCAAGTAADGTCTIRVDADAPGAVTIEVTAITVPGDEVDGDEDTVEVTPPALLTAWTVGDLPIDATGTKAWVRYAVSVDADAVNLTGDAHTFYVQVTRDAGDGPAGANGVLADLEWTGLGAITGVTLGDPGDLSDLGTCLTGTLTDRPEGIGLLPGDDDGWCTVTVNSDAPGEGTLAVAQLTAPDITNEVEVDGTTTTAFAVPADDASKTWIDVDVDVTPPAATNVAGDDHDFDVTVTVDGGGAEVTDVAICLTWDGVGTPTWDASEDADCLTAELDETPDADGRTVARLTVTVTAPEGPDALVDTAGMGTLSVDAVQVSVDRYGATWDFTVPEGDTGFGLAPGVTFPVEATKLWVDYGLRVTPPTAVNPLPGGEEHTFTVELRSSDPGTLVDGVYTPGGAPIAGEGVTVALDYTGVGTVLSGADVADDDALSCAPAAALVDDEVVGICEVVVATASDDATPSDGVGTGTLTATFTATADGDGELVLTDQGIKTWIAIELVKEATGGVELGEDGSKTVVVDPLADAGEYVVLYTYWITNPGPDALDLASLDDDRIGDLTDAMLAAADDVYGSSLLPAGDTLVVADVPYQLTDEDVDAGEVVNLAVVTGRSTEDPQVEVTAEDDERVQVELDLRPAIDIVKTVTPTSVDYDRSVDGDVELTYAYEITNIGNEPLTDLTLVDAYDLDRGLGEVTVDLTDEFRAAIDAAGHGSQLPVGASVTVTAAFTLWADEVAAILDAGAVLDNVATTTGIGVRSAEPVDASDDARVTFTEILRPAIALVKTATGADVTTVRDDEGRLVVVFDAEEGIDTAEVTYTFEITNTGNEPLIDLTLDDDKIGVLDASITVDRLEVGESTTVTATYTTTADDLAAGSVTNVATTTGVGETSGGSVDDTDDETVLLVEIADTDPEPGIRVVKTAVGGISVADDGRLLVRLLGGGSADVTYRFDVTNTGDEPLTDLTLVDDKIGDLSEALVAAVVAAHGEAILPVDATVSVTAVHRVSAADFTNDRLTNVAVVDGTGTESGGSVSDSDDETVTLLEVLDTVTTRQPTPTTQATATTQPLPRTGIDAGLLTALGVALMLLGLGALLATRRRRHG